MNSTWVENYYEAVEYYYWEPDKIRRMKDDPKLDTCEKVIARLRTIEVPLNHIIKQFFSLAPKSFRNVLFSIAFGLEVPGDFVMEGRNSDKKYELNGVTQPDFLFTTSEATVSIEMKIDAKCSIIQVIKYAFLALAVERKAGRKQRHSLIFIAPKKFSNLGVENCIEIEDLKKRLSSLTPHDRSELLGKISRDKNGALKSMNVGKLLARQDVQDRLFEIASELSVCFQSYREFATAIETMRPKPFDGSDSDEVYFNLIEGMISELAARKLLHESRFRCPCCPSCLAGVTSPTSLSEADHPRAGGVEGAAPDLGRS